LAAIVNLVSPTGGGLGTGLAWMAQSFLKLPGFGLLRQGFMLIVRMSSVPQGAKRECGAGFVP
jgi:hypothetical protein